MFAKVSSAEIRIRISDPRPDPDPEHQAQAKAQILDRIPDSKPRAVARPRPRHGPETRQISRKNPGDP